MRALRPLLVLLSVVNLVACSSSDRPRSNTRVPPCSAPICNDSCACDVTFSCDEACAACDVECGNCRTVEGNCRQPAVDAGTNPSWDAGREVDGGTEPADSGTEGVDAGSCEFPPAQPEGGPCCSGLGVDACSLGLFCDGYDGRNQTVCYRLGSRDFGETCHDQTHCGAGNCFNGVCSRGEGDSCTGPGQCPAPSICHPKERRCQQDGQFPCHPSTHEGSAATETCLFIGGGGVMCVTAGPGARPARAPSTARPA